LEARNDTSSRICSPVSWAKQLLHCTVQVRSDTTLRNVLIPHQEQTGHETSEDYH